LNFGKYEESGKVLSKENGITKIMECIERNKEDKQIGSQGKLVFFTFSKVVELGIGMFRNYGRNSFVQKEMVESNFIPYLVTKTFEFVDSPKVLVVLQFFLIYSRVVLQSLQLFQVKKMSKK
jgi:hypothetical protein